MIDTIKEVECAYYSHGFDIGFFVKTKKSRNRYEWFYLGGKFYDPVIDYLNRDYLYLAGCRPTVDGDSIIVFDEQFIRENADILGEYKTNAVEIYLPLINSDFSSMENTAIRVMADAVLCFTEPEKLTCIQKYSAFLATHKDESKALLDYNSRTCIDATITKTKYTEHLFIDEEGKIDNGIIAAYPFSDEEEATFAGVCKELVKNKYPVQMITKHTFDTLSDMVRFLIVEMIQRNIKVKKCKNCGKYFVPARSDAVFCGGQSPQASGKTCKGYGKYANFLEKTRNDEATRLYRQIYNSMNNKVRRYKAGKVLKGNIPIEEDLNDFISKSVAFKHDVKNGLKTIDEFIQWMREKKEKMR